MKKLLIIICLIAACMYVFAGCGYENEISNSGNSDLATKPSSGTSGPDTQTQDTNAPDTEKEEEMKIKVADENYEVIFRLNNSSPAKSLYEQLPLTIEVENYGSNEKIFYPPEKLNTSDVIEGACPAGTLAYFSSWGDVVMYYAPFGSYSGLYVMGEAVEGADCIKNLSGTITIKAT